jgi:polyisoprenoid-binding protein YceI
MQLEHYAIDPGASRLTLRPFASGAPSASTPNPTLTIRELSGEARLTPGTLDGASLEVKIPVASLALAESMEDGMTEQERRAIEQAVHRDILEADQYPEIVFTTSKVSASKAADRHYWINLLGDLRLHGVCRSEPIAAQVVVAGDALFVRGELTLAPSAYQIKPVPLAGGSLRLKQETKCVFDIVARRKPERATPAHKPILTVEGS